MKDYGEIPGGNKKLKPLLFPFHLRYPQKIWSRYRWWKNSKLSLILPSLNRKKKLITVIDRLGAPGDALITATVIRNLKKVYPDIKCNCITPYPELVEQDPHIDSLNQQETFYSLDSTYWELIVRKEDQINVVDYNLIKLGITNFEYDSKFYLTDQEKDWGMSQFSKLELNKPILAICTRSKESVKNWPIEYWIELLSKLKPNYEIIQLGDSNEPIFEGVKRFAGKTSMRESAALLSLVLFFIGPDSLLMHIANGLNIPSIIIFGGSRPVECLGYSQNINLSNTPKCSPCWIHDGFEECSHDLLCMTSISVTKVLSAIKKSRKEH